MTACCRAAHEALLIPAFPSRALFLPACGATWQIEKAYDTIMMQQLFRRKQGLTFGALKVSRPASAQR